VGIRATLGMMMVAALTVAACNKPPEDPAGEGKPKVNVSTEPKTRPDRKDAPDPNAPPADRLAEQLRSGAVQMEAALGSIEEAMKEAEKLKGTLPADLEDGLKEILDNINEAGEAVGDAAGDAPTLADIKRDFSGSDEDRLKRITAGNDARVALIGAANTADSMGEVNATLKPLAELLKVAAEDVEDAIFALGGQLEEA
jgi:hypothetical protein